MIGKGYFLGILWLCFVVGIIIFPSQNIYAESLDDLVYLIQGGEVEGFEIDHQAKSLIVRIDSFSDGFLTIQLPRAIIDSKSGTQDDIFFAISGNEEFNQVQVEHGTVTDTYRSVTIPFSYGDSTIEIIGTQVMKQKNKDHIPSWIKNVAGFWCENKIDDASFVEGVKYLIDNGIIKVSITSSDYGGSQNIPSWIKNNACWWSQDLTSDEDFVLGLEHLISSGIVYIEGDIKYQDNYIDGFDEYSEDISVDEEYYEPLPSQRPTEDPLEHCYGYADCFFGHVTKIVDGDTIEVDGKPIRFALVNTPEYGEAGYSQATNYIKKICPVGARVLVDEDDGQTQGSYGRMIALVSCEGVPTSLNEAVLAAGLAEMYTQFCDDSEFAFLDWAYNNGCKGPQEYYESVPQITVTTDRTFYETDDFIEISGQVSEILSGVQVTLQVFEPRFGNQVEVQNVNVISDKTYSAILEAGGGLWRSDGSYTVRVMYGSEATTAETTFWFEDVANAPPPESKSDCDPSYPDVCVPSPPPDLDCGEISHRNFRVIGSDPHRFDGDNDGIGCEGN